MSKKPDLILINTTPLDNIPIEAFDEFTEMVLDNKVKPSEAIQSIIKKHDCPDMHVTTIMHFLHKSYPDIDFGRKGFM